MMIDTLRFHIESYYQVTLLIPKIRSKLATVPQYLQTTHLHIVRIIKYYDSSATFRTNYARTRSILKITPQNFYWLISLSLISAFYSVSNLCHQNLSKTY